MAEITPGTFIATLDPVGNQPLTVIADSGVLRFSGKLMSF